VHANNAAKDRLYDQRPLVRPVGGWYACCMKASATCLVLIFGTALSAGAVQLAHSHEPESENAMFPYELTGYVGYQSGGEFDVEGTTEKGHVEGQVAYALGLNFRADNYGQYQVFYSRQPAHIEAIGPFPNGVALDIDYIHFGGTLRVDPGSLLEPYIVGSIGATSMSPKFPDSHDKAVFSVGVGAGLRVPVSKQFNILLEGRAFFSFLPSGGALFCSSGQTGAGCRFQGSGSTFSQYVVLVGASYAF
jgi:hypothetical protein